MTSRARGLANFFSPAVAASVGDAASGGVTVYNTPADLPSSPDNGSLAFVLSTNAFYLARSNVYWRIALISEPPTGITGNVGTYVLAIDGTPTTVTLSSTDPEGYDIEWSAEVTGNTSAATVTNVDNVFTITPSTNPLDAGIMRVNFIASDGGVSPKTSISDFTLSFFPEDQAVFHYNFGDTSSYPGTGDVVYNLLDNDHTATVIANANFLDGAFGDLVQNSGIRLPAGGDTNYSSTNTWGVTYKHVSGTGMLFDMDGDDSSNSSYRTGAVYGVNADGTPYVFLVLDNGNKYTYTSTVAATDPLIYNTYLISRDHTTGEIKFYINGSLVDTVAGVAGTRKLGGSYSNGTYNFGFNSNPVYPENSPFTGGYFSSVAFWNKVLSDEEALVAHYSLYRN